jgi:hypothetical protein
MRHTGLSSLGLTMPTDTTESGSEQRVRALHKTRRRLRWLEVALHRIKAEIARLEAVFEDDIADRLSGKRRLRMRHAKLRVDSSQDRPAAGEFEGGESLSASDQLALPDVLSSPEDPPVTKWLGEASSPPFGSAASIDGNIADAVIDEDTSLLLPRERERAQFRPLLVSSAFHLLAICILLPVTVATIAKQQPEFSLSTLVELSSEPADEIVLAEFTADTPIDGLPSPAILPGPLAIPAEILPTDNLLAGLDPGEDTPKWDTNVGLSETALLGPAEAGTILPGGIPAGRGEGNGVHGGGGGGFGDAPGFSTFFGTRSQGDRFVFIVDNSSSMKDGRLEAALAELVRSVEAMGRRQSFYVIFVADQVYPMFFPDRASETALATPENKQRLKNWLGKVQLAGGNNRELIKAIDLAAELRPHAVYLLWDGDLRYSESVRRDVMNHLTSPQPWEFAIHTLGMGSLTAANEQNLFAIARAHNGTYRRIDVPKSGMR